MVAISARTKKRVAAGECFVIECTTGPCYQTNSTLGLLADCTSTRMFSVNVG